MSEYDNREEDPFDSWQTNGGKDRALVKEVIDIFHKILFAGKTPKQFHDDHKDVPGILASAFPLTMDEETLQAKMPATFLVTAERDLLRDEGQAKSGKLQSSGIFVEAHCYEDEHGFMCTQGKNDNFEDCLGKLKIWLDKL